MKLTPEQLRQNAAAMIAFAEGERVEALNKEYTHHGFTDASPPSWNFTQYDYRPKPKPAMRAWSRPEDVPGPVCWILDPDGSTHLVHSVIEDSIGYGWTRHKWVALSNKSYSTDRKTWQKCEVPA